MTLYKWSQTPASNATADSTINWAEGQAPSSVNDSARAMMTAVSKYRDDIAGAIVTGGTSTTYTVSSYEVFDSTAHMNGQMIAFTPHVTNGAGPVRMTVDGFTVFIRSAPNVDLQAGVLIQGTPYVGTYNSGDNSIYLQNFYGNPYNVPLGAGMDFWLPTAPNSSFVFPIGQAISRTTYSALFALMGTTYGAGDTTTTFNLPDKTGRVSAMKESSATRLTTAGGGVDGATLGSANGLTQNGTISQANLPAVTLTTTVTDPGHGHPGSVGQTQSGGAYQGNIATAASNGGNAGSVSNAQTLTIASNTTGITASTALGGSGTAFKIVQPTIVCNYILRII